MKRLTKKKGQKKVRNATPNEYDGIKFRSKLETYTYKKLKEANIIADYEMHRYELLPAFTFDNKKYRAMTYLPDFVGDNFIIECKGKMNDAFPLKWKMFKYFCISNNMQHTLYLPRNQKQVDLVIQDIIKNALDTAADYADTEFCGNMYDPEDNTQCINRGSITNTFEETFKKYKL